MKTISYAKILSVSLITIPLSGCLSAAQIQARNAAALAQMSAVDDATCRMYGATYGTPEYVQCRENLANQRQENFRAVLDEPRPPEVTVVNPRPVFVEPTYGSGSSAVDSAIILGGIRPNYP